MLVLMKIKPARHLHGSIRLPGDKSISHRAALLAAMAEGTTRIENFSTSRDCQSTVECLRQLGVRIEQVGTRLVIEGAGADGLRQAAEPLDCGNSGSTMRMLAGMLAAQDFASELTGDASLRTRPMRRIIEPLEKMGAVIESNDGRAPLLIRGRRPLKNESFRMAVPSAQVKSCILLAALGAEGKTEVSEQAGSTRDHTERMLRWLGVEAKSETDNDGWQTISLDGPVTLKARDIEVPGDLSSASFFLVAGAALSGSELLISDVGVNPTRTEILETLCTIGVDVQIANVRVECNEPVADLLVRSGDPSAFARDRIVLNGPVVARLIDELPVIAVLGTQLDGGLEIRDAKELRVKESDRISATVRNLRAMGVEVEEYEDGLAVAGPATLRGAALKSYGDHRIAMAFTVAALLAEGESEIEDAECVDVSFPDFFEILDSVVQR
jgi:3-phosphoshikimate 1-carboxyvinyltransferase